MKVFLPDKMAGDRLPYEPRSFTADSAITLAVAFLVIGLISALIMIVP